MFFDQADRFGDAPLLWAKKDGAYRLMSWRQVADQVGGLRRGLKSLGVEPGDRVVVVSENRPEWLIADLAIMAAGAITVPAYVTNTVENHLHVLVDSGAETAIVSTDRLAGRLLPAAEKAPDLRNVVIMSPLPGAGGRRITLTTWAETIEGPGTGDDTITEVSRLRRDDTACIIYTSGTGGAPKGVMLSHGAILHNCAGATEMLKELGLGEEVFLSFLPLSHSYEHTVGQFLPLSIGAQIYYAEGTETLAADMVEVGPTIMTAVPRLYETLHSRILRGVRKAGGIQEKLFMKALDLGRRRLQQPDGLTLGQKLADALLDKLVRDKVRRRFGGRLKALVSGGAPLNPDIGLFFTALGLRILQGYGLTETAPIISVNRPGDVKMNTVGPPMRGVEVKIAEDGEILVKGELVMQGYWRKADATNEVIRDGWLHTGDIGEFDADGHITITDRKKDIIVNSGGENFSPQRIEGVLTLETEIAQAMVYGDKRPHLVGLLVPDGEWMKTWARDRGKSADLSLLGKDEDFRKAIGGAVERVNGRLSKIEKLRRFTFADAPFTIDNGQLTPTMKIRRHKIKEAYGERLESLYGVNHSKR
ncbi:MAG: long-chain fatty acid--CoA ligase [Rhodospirillales bacterium]|jgi:long-chain acyl-CoA synthetase|nr:long-chain fatty acid--CoA ligase [Rhodospirillales bacterium]MDP7215656.1 long-chain fatty acid--CoA ligase [Rhodospirillales bacterium]MDP7458637.1 long-chain fatty acid--CoA ligase [Alphaproteobacteria bacterium]